MFISGFVSSSLIAPVSGQHHESNQLDTARQLFCLETFPFCGHHRKPPTLTVNVPSLRSFRFHFSQISN